MRLSQLDRGLLTATGVLVALCVTGCTAGGSGNAAQPTLPSFSSSLSAPPSESSSAPSSQAPPASGATEATVPSEAASPNDCKSAELRLSLGRAEGAAGTVYRALRFTNVGTRTCTIQGFPGVSYVAGADGHQVGPAAFRDGAKGPAINLNPGSTANSPVGFTQVGNFDPNVCRPTPIRGLRVYPPHDTASVIVAMDGTGCAGTPPGNQLVVKTVQ
jgi:hypothetical protein